MGGENRGARGFVPAGRIGFASLSRCVDWRPAESLTMPGDCQVQEGKKGVRGALSPSSLAHCHPYHLHQTQDCVLGLM